MRRDKRKKKVLRGMNLRTNEGGSWFKLSANEEERERKKE